jgi:hypothetical protein
MKGGRARLWSWAGLTASSPLLPLLLLLMLMLLQQHPAARLNQ